MCCCIQKYLSNLSVTIFGAEAKPSCSNRRYRIWQRSTISNPRRLGSPWIHISESPPISTQKPFDVELLNLTDCLPQSGSEFRDEQMSPTLHPRRHSEGGYSFYWGSSSLLPQSYTCCGCFSSLLHSRRVSLWLRLSDALNDGTASGARDIRRVSAERRDRRALPWRSTLGAVKQPSLFCRRPSNMAAYCRSPTSVSLLLAVRKLTALFASRLRSDASAAEADKTSLFDEPPITTRPTSAQCAWRVLWVDYKLNGDECCQ